MSGCMYRVRVGVIWVGVIWVSVKKFDRSRPMGIYTPREFEGIREQRWNTLEVRVNKTVHCYAKNPQFTHQYSIASSNKPDNCSLSS